MYSYFFWRIAQSFYHLFLFTLYFIAPGFTNGVTCSIAQNQYNSVVLIWVASSVTKLDGVDTDQLWDSAKEEIEW